MYNTSKGDADSGSGVVTEEFSLNKGSERR